MANLAQIYDWFMTGKKPTQAQFWASWGSFWNKEETIPQSAITNLTSTLNAKTENDQFNAHKVALDAHTDLFLEKEDKDQKGAANGYLGLDAFSKPIGLENVDNTADVDKEVSIPQQQALENKVDKVAGERLINAAEIEKLEIGIYTKTEVDAKVSSVYKFMGNVANYASLPNTELVIGHVYNLIDTGANYAWTGAVWDEIGTTIDISGKEDVSNKSQTIEADKASITKYGSVKAIVDWATSKFLTAQDVLNTLLAGLSVPTATGSWTILPEDKLITALGKLQFFINNLTDRVNVTIRRADVKWIPYTGTNIPVLLPNNSNDSCFDIRGGVSEIVGYASGVTYFGQINSIKNTQTTDITLRHLASSSAQMRFVFQNGLNYVLKPGYIARFSYVGTGPLGENTGNLYFLGINEDDLMHKSGDETIAGIKSYLNGIRLVDGKPHEMLTAAGGVVTLNSLDYTFFTQVYGVQRDLSIAAPEWTRIGNMELHASLPVHSLIRRCLVTDAGVVTYLNSENSALKADGSAADLTGAAGQVMVEIPEHYRRFSQDGNNQTVLYSLSPFTGAEKIPKKYASAFKATVERATSKLASVVNATAAFRGGNNNSAFDAAANTQLGKPASSISRTSFETFGSNRGANWSNMDYQVRKDIYWLIVAEYATSNHQAAYNAVKTAEGYRQGALGNGPTDIDSGNWNTFNGYNPLFNCGTTLALGNNTGVKDITLNDFPTTGLSKATQTISYRGLENIFGDIWEWTSGINIKTNNGSAVVFVKNNKALNSSVDYFSYRPVGSMPINNGYISKIIFGAEGDIMPKEANGSATTYFSDYYYQSNPAVETLRGVLFGGLAHDGSYAGSAYSYSGNVPSLTYANFGSRLCFLP